MRQCQGGADHPGAPGGGVYPYNGRRSERIDGSSGYLGARLSRNCRPELPAEELVSCQADIRGDLAKQNGREISSLVDRHRGHAAIWMSELLVRTPLADFFEAVLLEQANDLSRLEDGQIAQRSTYRDQLRAYELGIERRIPVFEHELDRLPQMGVELVESPTL